MTTTTIRDRLGKAGIRLHSIMLDTENQKLRDASNVYQIVKMDEQGMFLHQPVVNEQVYFSGGPRMGGVRPPRETAWHLHQAT